jgi:DNA polymerase III delta subunit
MVSMSESRGIDWPCILLRGNDSNGINSALKKIQELFENSGGFVQHDLTDESSPDEFQQILHMFSLTMDRKIIVFRSPDFFTKKRTKFVHAKWHEVFQSFLTNYSGKDLLIIITEEGGAIEAEIYRLIIKLGVEKIYTVPGGSSSKDAASGDAFFRIADAIVARDINVALKHSVGIPASDVIQALSMIGWSLRLLTDFVEMKSTNAKEREIVTALGLKPFQYNKFDRAYQVWTEDSSKKAVKKLAEIDYAIKSTGIDPKRAFEAMLYDLCQK